MSRYSSASSQTAGLRPSNRAGLCRLPSGGKGGLRLQALVSPEGPLYCHRRTRMATHFTGCWPEYWAPEADGGLSLPSRPPSHDGVAVPAQLWRGLSLTCTHDALHTRVLDAALHVPQALDVPIGKHGDSHCLPVGVGRRGRPSERACPFTQAA